VKVSSFKTARSIPSLKVVRLRVPEARLGLTLLVGLRLMIG